MSDGMIISETDIVYRRWNSETKVYDEVPIEPEDVITRMWDTVEFRGPVTLGRLFAIVATDPEAWEAILQENIEPLVEEMNKSVVKMRDREGMEHLELCWGAESSKYDTGDTDFDIMVHFHGKGTVPEGDEGFLNAGYKVGDPMSYGIEFTPVNELRDFEVCLDTKVTLIINDLTHVYERYDPPTEMAIGDKQFTVLDVFKGIFWELTFCGSPEDRDEKFAELEETVEDCKRHFGSEEFLKQLESEDEKDPENPIDIKDWKSDEG